MAGMNIDACRIGTSEQSKGRWPANLLLDEEAADMLNQQTGVLKSGVMKAGQKRKASKGENGGYHGNMPDEATASDTYGDSGGASRFFYCRQGQQEASAGLATTTPRSSRWR